MFRFLLPLLQPLLQEPQSGLAVAFEKLNGFKSEVLCEYFI